MSFTNSRGNAKPERTWGMFPTAAAVAASYVWLGLCVGVLAAPHNGAPGLVKAACVGCWGAVGFWVWERTDQVNDDYGHGPAAAGGLLFRFAFTLVMGAACMCIAGPVVLWRKLNVE